MPCKTNLSDYSGDLLSDVTGLCGDASVLITTQNHLNAIAELTPSGGMSHPAAGQRKPT